MKYNIAPWVIRQFTAKEFVEKDFPNDKLGVGDKLILSRSVKEEVDKLNVLTKMLIVCVKKRMQDYGFKPKLELKKYF